MKLQPQNQGKIIADYNNDPDEWVVMFPDGTVQIFTSRKTVEIAAKEYFQKGVKPGHIGFGKIEWRT